jgi:hypothetical protein
LWIESIWIGITDLTEEGDWRSITTGENLSYTNWSTNNPDNDKGKQHCGTLNWGGPGKFDDNDCATQLTFICEV